MIRKTDNKLVLVTQKTRLEELVYRYNTEGQARFYIEHHGGDFSDYQQEHERYQAAKQCAAAYLETYGRLQIVERQYLPSYLFGKNDLVIALGRDGLVANVLKYLTTQRLVGVNPDPARWDGVLLPFAAEDLPLVVPETFAGIRKTKDITFAQALLNDGQQLYGVNDLFIGQKTHTSARYEISIAGKTEVQSSSGIIVSTGLGATGWLKSILAGAAGIDRFFGIQMQPQLPDDLHWDTRRLYYTVREPYPSTSTAAGLVFGGIEASDTLQIKSLMPENGVIFSDGMEQDYLSFNSGTTASVTVAQRSGSLVI